MKPNKQGKYVIASPSYKSTFLPSPSDVSELLGLPANIIKMIPLAEEHHGIPLNVGRSSRAEMTNNGVAKPTMSKLAGWMNKLPIPFKQLIDLPLMLKTYRAMRVGSNAGLWYSVSNGFKLSSHDSEFITLFDFIDMRAEADYQMVKGIKHQIREKIIDKNDTNAIWQAQLGTWTRHSMLPAEQLACLTNFFSNINDPMFHVEANAIAVKKAEYHLRFDFYLSAIASYEVGLLLYASRQMPEIEIKSNDGVFSSVISTYAVSNEECTCFGAMLMELRNILARHDHDSGWRALASYIDIEESGNKEDLLNDKQYRQIRDWRNRKNMPSDKRLRQFITNVANDLGDYEIESTLIYLRIANAIDTLVERLLEETNDHRILVIIAEVLECYPKYFERFKLVYFNKNAQTT
ncbi:hypothetical protein [Shewanella sp. SR43-8]|uniref:hypothetical protein n=1 Tax=Shewanella sp. SR43-8 TaxID=2760938 RepID=UPI001603AA3A|nr:hypothetical protein [Shewanella sp. SR43-8]MBB1323549.1 hypothetical protein [Shewanella sp. SR43-8]